MRLLIYSINYFPEPTGIGKYNGEMAEWLADHGHEVTVITAPPYYPWWQTQPPYHPWFYRTEIINSVQVYRCPLWVPRRPTGIKRLMHLFSFALTSIPPLLIRIFKRPDIIIVLEPTLFCAPAVLGLARISGAKIWLHVQDFEVDAALNLGLIRTRSIGAMAVSLERWLMKRFDRVSTISGNMLERLSSKNVAQEKSVLFPNWVDTQHIFPIPAACGFRTELHIREAQCVVLYSGNMGEKQGLEILLEAAKILQDEPELLFVLCGTGSARERLMQIGQGLHNVLWLSLQPAEKLNELLNIADVHLLPQRADTSDLVMPSKLLGMLASGRPVLATAHPGTQLAKVVSSCGKVVTPGDAQEVARGLLELFHAPTERKRLGIEALKAAQAWEKTLVLSSFERELVSLNNA